MKRIIMSYLKAEDHLPDELIREIQKYIQGAQIYIPGDRNQRLNWGERNGTRERLKKRNQEIKKLKRSGLSLDDLADRYHLSTDSIRKILYRKEGVV